MIFINEILQLNINWTALHFATYGSQLDVIKILLNYSQELLNLKDEISFYFFNSFFFINFNMEFFFLFLLETTAYCCR